MGQDMRGYLEWEWAERDRKERNALKARVKELESYVREDAERECEWGGCDPSIPTDPPECWVCRAKRLVSTPSGSEGA